MEAPERPTAVTVVLTATIRRHSLSESVSFSEWERSQQHGLSRGRFSVSHTEISDLGGGVGQLGGAAERPYREHCV